MARDGLDDAEIARILRETRRIALVGASNRPERPSHGVMRFLLGRGWTVVPVNPGLAGQTLLGQPVVASLEEAGPLDMVDIFRASDQAGAVVDDAIRLGRPVRLASTRRHRHGSGGAGPGRGLGRRHGPLPGHRGATSACIRPTTRLNPAAASRAMSHGDRPSLHEIPFKVIR